MKFDLAICGFEGADPFWTLNPLDTSTWDPCADSAQVKISVLQPATIHLVSNSSKWLHHAARRIRASNLKTARHASPEPWLAALPHAATSDVTLCLNPFFASFSADRCRDVLARGVSTRRIACTVRAPEPHPLQFFLPWATACRNGKLSLCSSRTNYWHHCSAYFTFRGEKYPICRQNYPPVVEACGAAMAFPSRVAPFVPSRIKAGDFEMFAMGESERHNHSNERERMEAQMERPSHADLPGRSFNLAEPEAARENPPFASTVPIPGAP